MGSRPQRDNATKSLLRVNMTFCIAFYESYLSSIGTNLYFSPIAFASWNNSEGEYDSGLSSNFTFCEVYIQWPDFLSR
jgi:hypothetical protein